MPSRVLAGSRDRRVGILLRSFPWLVDYLQLLMVAVNALRSFYGLSDCYRFILERNRAPYRDLYAPVHVAAQGPQMLRDPAADWLKLFLG